MLRDCEAYKAELKACKSIKGRFYQYYVDGQQADCSHWADCYDDCQLWKYNVDEEAATRVIDRENERVKERLRGHYENNVWEKRTTPPPKEEWNKPLPKYMLDRQENSYLAMYVNMQEKEENATEAEMIALKSTEVTSSLINNAPTCTIL